MKALLKPLLALVATLLALGIAEGLTRLSDAAPEVKAINLSREDDPALAYRRSDNPLLGFELKPGYRNPDADLLRSYPEINSYGQRDIERKLKKAAGVRRVLMLGDSVVEGVGIRELDDTLSQQLEKRYEAGTVEVLNFGISGYCTLSEVELLETRGLRFEPELVVLVFTENDFHNFNRIAFELAARRPRPLWVDQLFVSSDLFRLTTLKLDLWGLKQDMDPIAANTSAIGDNNVVTGLERLAKLKKRAGFELLIAVWPRFGKASIDDLHYVGARPAPHVRGELIIEQLAGKHGMSVRRLSDGFREDWDAADVASTPVAHYTVGDGLHPNPQGTRVASKLLFDVLGGTKLEVPAAAAPKAPTQDAVEEAAAIGDTRVADRSVIEFNKGVAQMESGDLVAAIPHLMKAIELRPDYAEAHNNIGIILAQAAQPAAAERHFRVAMKSDPGSVDPLNNLAMVLMQMGRFDEAAQAFDASLKLRPDPRIRAGLEEAIRLSTQPR